MVTLIDTPFLRFSVKVNTAVSVWPPVVDQDMLVLLPLMHIASPGDYISPMGLHCLFRGGYLLSVATYSEYNIHIYRDGILIL